MCPVGREKRRTLVLTVVSPGEVVRAGVESVEGRALLFSSQPVHNVMWSMIHLICEPAMAPCGVPPGFSASAVAANGQMVHSPWRPPRGESHDHHGHEPRRPSKQHLPTPPRWSPHQRPPRHSRRASAASCKPQPRGPPGPRCSPPSSLSP